MSGELRPSDLQIFTDRCFHEMLEGEQRKLKFVFNIEHSYPHAEVTAPYRVVVCDWNNSSLQ